MRFSQSNFYKEFSTLSLHRKLYLVGFTVLSIGLPLSPILVSISQFILAGTWLVEGNFQAKFEKIKSNRILWAFFLLPALHLIWLFNTSDFQYALHDLKIKIPLFIFPLILGTITPLSVKELRWILYSFIFGVFCGTFVSFAVLTGIYPIEYNDIRGISIFISHIRFGLMILLSILITTYYANKYFIELNLWKKISLSILVIWFLLFLVILQSLTSWVALILLIIYSYTLYYKKIQTRFFQIFIWAVLTIIFLTGVGVVTKVYYDFYFTKTQNFNTLPKLTPYGNTYLNDTTAVYKENGNFIRILICQKELYETWPQLSKIPFNGRDANGYPIANTLIRYLTSKNLPKDHDGLMELDPEDIRMIEDGYASCIYRKKFIPYVKIYNVIWEVDRYIKSGDANNKSIVQRIEFSHAALHIIKNNFWFGVGTGDLNNAYKEAYVKIKSVLKEENQLRAHNQFLTFFVTFGFIGFLLALYSMFYPGYKKFRLGGIMFSGFLIMIFISMLNEDTLETQAGVTFYIAFYTLFIFSNNNHDA